MKKLSLIILIVITCGQATAQKPVYDLVERISPGSSKQFLFELVDQDSEIDVFEIDQKGLRIWIKGNNNISIATGLNWYLKHHAGIHISWNNPKAYLAKLPKVKTPERHTTDVLLRYYLSHSAFAYSTPFWDWTRWEQEIDFMALHGINLPLSITGMGSVWRNVLLKLGCTKDEIETIIPNQIYQPWFLTGQVTGAGDYPNSDYYYSNQERLQKRILERYLEWGIEPVFAGYNGMIPESVAKKLGAATSAQNKWRANESSVILSPNDPMFAKIAQIYYTELKSLYGESKYFSVPETNDNHERNWVSVVYEQMYKANSDATWIVSPSDGSVAEELPAGKALLLYAQGIYPNNAGPNDKIKHHDQIYCLTQNYGGRTGLYGQIQQVIDGYYTSSRVGVGISSEGIENNAVMYELIYELPWRQAKFSKEEWINQWTKARYGREIEDMNQAWNIMANTVYNNPDEPVDPVICARPALKIDHVSMNGATKTGYDFREFERAFEMFLGVSDRLHYSDNYKYDLVDMGRQAITNRANEMLPRLWAAFESGDKKEFGDMSRIFLDMILLQDRLMSSRPEFLVGAWIENAMKLGDVAEEKESYRQAAKRVLTIWGDRNVANLGGLHDYAYREWSGLLRDFYFSRWKYFFDQINTSGILLVAYDFYDMENAWVVDELPYSQSTSADEIAMAGEVLVFLNRHKF